MKSSHQNKMDGTNLRGDEQLVIGMRKYGLLHLHFLVIVIFKIPASAEFHLTAVFTG